MPRKTGQSRIQYGLFATPLEDLIAPDNMVRVIDAFVDSLRNKDLYTCPNNQELTTSGKWHEKRGRQGLVQARFKLYRCSFSICSACPFREQCLSEANMKIRHSRRIERSEYEDAVLENKKRILLHRDKYKRRQAIVEHPFGTIKRSWGFHYTLLKGKEKVGGEMAIIFTSYNLHRVVSILGIKGILEALKNPKSGHFALWRVVKRPTPIKTATR